MMLLSLDQSTSACGWALGKPGAEPRYGTYQPPKSVDEYGPMLAAFGEWLRSMIEENGVTHLAFEQPFMPKAEVKYVFNKKMGRKVPIAFVASQVGTLRKLYALAGMIEFVCFDMEVDCVEVNIGQWRSFFLERGPDGKKLLKKNAVAPQCRAYGWEPKNDNEADALGIHAFVSHGYGHAFTQSAGALFSGSEA